MSEGYDRIVEHPEDLERWRAMSPADRLRIGLELMDMAWLFLQHLPPEEAQRRLDLAREPWRGSEVRETPERKP